MLIVDISYIDKQNAGNTCSQCFNTCLTHVHSALDSLNTSCKYGVPIFKSCGPTYNNLLKLKVYTL